MTFLNSIVFTVINKYHKRAAVQISTVFGLIYHVPCPSVLWSGTFWIFTCFRKYIACECHLFFESVQNLLWVLESAEKNWEKFFRFWDNCIWIGCVKHSLLKTEDLSKAVNLLNTSLKILHLTKSDFFKLNCLHRNQ